MADEGTLATTAQVLLAIGSGASADQVLEANTNIWILQAEAIISLACKRDFVAEYGTIIATYKQSLAMAAASKAAMLGINQNQNQWTLATAQSKLNVLNKDYKEAIRELTDKEKQEKMGLTNATG